MATNEYKPFFMAKLIIIQNLLQSLAFSLLLGLALGENLVDDDGYQTEGIDTNGHSAALLGSALFLQPVAMVGQSHVVSQFGGYDVDGDRWMLGLNFRGIESHRRRLYWTDSRTVVQLRSNRFVSQPLFKVVL